MWQMNVLRQGLVGNLFASLWANVVAVEYDGSSNASTMVLQMLEQIDFRPVILAGGSGTRFWPRSRRAHAKQVLALDGERSMIQQTVERLKPLAGLEKTWIITNEYLAREIADQLPGLPAAQIVQEPVARNTAPACGLAAFLIERENPNAVLGVFPSDHVIADEPRFLKALQKGIAAAAAGENIVVLGIEPFRAETGYGYIETGDLTKDDSALHVRRFIEKPNQNRADEFVAAGNYYWNSGMFLWSARTLANAVREHLPETAPLLEAIAAAWGTPQFDEVFRTAYPKCENISVDYAVLEPRSAKGEHLSHLYCIPAEFNWNDLGSWASLYEYQVETRLRGDAEGNVADSTGHISIEASDNYIFSPKKFVALVGVENLVVVDTEDALLIAHRDHSQDVGKIVKELSITGRSELI
jgi:mannose-1-phosphate guanylyltransferase